MKTKDSFFVFQKVIFKSPPLLKIEFKKSLKRTPLYLSKGHLEVWIFYAFA